MKKLIVAAIIAATALSPAVADQCSVYVNTTVDPLTFGAATAPYLSLGPKGEYETTAHYQHRVAALSGGLPLIIAKVPEGREFFKYDADKGSLGIQEYAFDGGRSDPPFDFARAFRGAGIAGVRVSGMLDIEAVISRNDRITGRYAGSNAFGATRNVERIARSSRAIYDRAGFGYDHGGLFPQANEGALAGNIPMSAPEARSLKPVLKLAFVVQPKPPYFASGVMHESPTIDTPSDITDNFQVLFADFQCALVLDSRNKVIGSFPAGAKIEREGR